MRLSLLCIFTVGILVSCGVPDYPGYKMSPYTVRGHRYVPMSIAQALHYEKVGEASWYQGEGGLFSSAKTALGEPMKSGTMCAAHTTLPLPCVVKIKNLENGKSLKVRVNDRGPFVKNRLIDVSQAVAEDLDMKKKGVTKVRVTVLSVGDGHWKKIK